MAWQEYRRLKKGKVWKDGPRERAVLSVGEIHYESVEGSGEFDTPYDFTARRVNNAQLNGYRITDSNWHFAIQSQTASQSQSPIGTVGYGGRRGSHWFRFRLDRVGYIHYPTRNVTPLGGAASYDPAKLSVVDNTRPFGFDQITSGSRFEWRDLWTTPGGGEVYAQWRNSAYGLKEEIVINQAGREWLQANNPPATPASETFFGFRFSIDASDIPKRVLGGIERALDEDFDDETDGLELRDSLDRLLGFMPLDYVYVPNRGGRARVRKRFFFSGGQGFLFVGARVSELASLAPGDLIFDPSIPQESIGANADDGYEDQSDGWNVSGYSNNNFWGDYSTGDVNSGVRFQTVPIPQGATINSATLQLYRTSLTGTDPECLIYCDDGNDSDPIFQLSDRPSQITPTTAQVTWNSSFGSNGAYVSTPDISAPIEEKVGRAGWSSGNDLRIALIGQQTPGNDYMGWEDYNAGSSNHALLDVDYSSGGQSASGTPSTAVPTASGSAGVTRKASGTPSIALLTSSGAALLTRLASGAPVMPSTEAAGAALRQLLTSGTPSTPFPTAAGTAVQEEVASGTPSTAVPTATGAASKTAFASGAPASALPTATGSATAGSEKIASGTPSTALPTSSGDAAKSVLSTGAPSVAQATASGSAAKTVKASGTPALTVPTASGSAARILLATGTAAIALLTSAGTAVRGVLYSIVGAVGSVVGSASKAGSVTENRLQGGSVDETGGIDGDL